MKCPLSREVRYDEGYYVTGDFKDCLKEECAWWDEERMCCHIRTLSKQVDRLADRANEIRDKMPHANQFTK